MKTKMLSIIGILLMGVPRATDREIPVVQEKPRSARSYYFSNGTISRDVLENYLSRSITQAEYLSTEGFYNDGPYPYQEDDFRMIKNIGAKFIGRSLYSWDIPEKFNDPRFLENARDRAAAAHVSDPDLVFQACIFEIVSTKVGQVLIPPFVFEAFALPFEHRTFDYQQMLNDEGRFVDHWRVGASVPDITKRETQLFFYYLAVQYMKTGIEAIHFGQAELMCMGDLDGGSLAWKRLLDRVRESARLYARRGTVLCDAHVPNGGLLLNGELLFDFLSFPMRIKEVKDEPQKGELQQGYLDALYNKTKGGLTPSGWSCEASPYLVEFDNFGISREPNEPNLDSHYVWGYDEISWFARQPKEYRNEFLVYANQWIRQTDTNGFVQMPGSRVVTGLQGNRYRANMASEACPLGFGQEETIKQIWSLE